MIETTSNAMNMKNMNFAMPVAAPAIPVNPNNAATIAINKNENAQRNIASLLAFNLSS